MYILDATAFIEAHDVEGPTATVPRVRDELQDASAYRYDAMEGSGMHIQIPDDAALNRVRSVAEDTGDRETLSETDVQLLAGALELDATIVTDDYAIQNVAERLDVPVEIIAEEGIEEVRDWQYQCQGCGREFDERRERCPVCGSDLSRKRPS